MGLFDIVLANLLSPPVLFFGLGALATLLRSDLRFPEALYLTLTVYLLTSIGLKGGAALSEAGLGAVLLPSLAAALLGAAIPLWSYPILRYLGRLRSVDAAALAAHYGSVSAVTFIAATQFLKELGLTHEPYASAFLAVMESPALIVGILLGKIGEGSFRPGLAMLGAALREALVGRSVLLLLGGLGIGALCGPAGLKGVAAFFLDPFLGVLSLFLLELGMVAARRLDDVRKVGPFLLGFGVLAPLVHGGVGVILGQAVGLSLGGATLLGTLAASASYIAAPAAMRLSLPEANPSLYLTASLAVTFPFNLTLGIPTYLGFARWYYSQP